MNYSSIHSKLSETHPDVLNDPEKYLGLNYATILNFWWFVDGLNSEQAQLLEKIYNYTDYNTISDRYSRLEGPNYLACSNILWDVAVSVCAGKDLSEMCGFEFLMAWITLELKVMHELFNEGLPLVFVPMLGELCQSPNCPPNHP
jgi:hypothetical protein